MDPWSKTIELLAIEYPMKIEGLKSCLLPIGQSEERTRDSNACGTRSLGVSSQGFARSSCPNYRTNLVVRVEETSRRGSWVWVFSCPWFSKDDVHAKNSHYNKRFRIAFTATVKLYLVTKFSLYLSFTVYYFYTGISCFMLYSSSRLISNNFFLLISNLRNYHLASHVAVFPKGDSKGGLFKRSLT